MIIKGINVVGAELMTTLSIFKGIVNSFKKYKM